MADSIEPIQIIIFPPWIVSAISYITAVKTSQYITRYKTFAEASVP